MPSRQNILSIEEYNKDIRYQAGIDASKYTCHIFTGDQFNNNIHSSEASGVFVGVGDDCFLFTAAHAVEKQQNDVFIDFGGEEDLKLRGDWRFNPLSDNMQREDDKINVAVLKLEEELVNIIRRCQLYKILSSDEIQISHEIKYTQSYVVVGFPAELNNYNNSSENGTVRAREKSTPLICAESPVSNYIYHKSMCDSSPNIIIHYDVNDVFNRTANKYIDGQLPPYGISGGGLWYIPIQKTASNDRVEKKLVGILTTWYNREYWIATPIDFFTEIIRREFNSPIDASTLASLRMMFY